MKRVVAVFVVILAAACDGDVAAPGETTAGGAASATGTGNGASSTGGSGNAGTTAVSGVGGAGAAGGGVSTAAGGSSMAGGAGPCAGLAEAPCMASAECAPVYDDICCPTCEPLPCADCSNWEFHHCDLREAVCDQPPECGSAPDWVCSGAPHVCPAIVDGDPYVCEATPGCVVAVCSLDDPDCPADKCAAVRGDSCSAECFAVPPACPPGTSPEAERSCWTGYCVPSTVCP